MAISPTAPIARFGRWIDTLSPVDFCVMALLSPVLGVASLAGPAWLAANSKPRPQDLLGYSIEHLEFQAILWLFVSGVVVALLSRRLGVWAASTVMAAYFLGIFFDLAADAPGHNLLPFELAIYCVFTAFAVAGAGMVALVRR